MPSFPSPPVLKCQPFASSRSACLLQPLGAVVLREEGGTIVGRPQSSEHIPPEVRELREKAFQKGS